MAPSLKELPVNEAQVDELHRTLERFKHWQPPPPNQPSPPLDVAVLVRDVVSSTRLALSLHSSLSQLSARHAKQTRLLERVQADNQRLRRENDACVDQLFLHAVPVESALNCAKLNTRKARREKRTRQQTASEQASFLSGFESTDEEEEEEATDSDQDSASRTASSGSECPSRTDADECRSNTDGPSRGPAPFHALVQSLVNHPSSQHVHTLLSHLSTLLTLQASQPLSATPASLSSQPSSDDKLDRTGSSGASSAYERSAELSAVATVREQLQLGRSRRSRRVATQLRQLVAHQAAEMAAMRAELDVLRSAAYDSHAGAAARDTAQLHEWMAAATERLSRQDKSRHTATNGAVSRPDSGMPLRELADIQRLYELLDSVMRHVQHSGVHSQTLVEDAKRLYARQGENAAVEGS